MTKSGKVVVIISFIVIAATCYGVFRFFRFSFEMKKKAEALSGEGMTPMWVAVNGSIAGIIAVADTLKENSQAAIAALHHFGLEVNYMWYLLFLQPAKIGLVINSIRNGYIVVIAVI